MIDERESCGGLIKQIHDALERNANNAMRPQGMTMAQFGVLLALRWEEDGTLPLKVLEQRLHVAQSTACLLYTSPSPRDRCLSRMPSSA